MATFTAVAEVTVMHIVARMAATAHSGREYLLVHRFAVAGVTLVGGLFVRPIQLELGLVVVEIPSTPRAGGVANLAFGAQSALVHFLVVFFMA